MSAPEIDPNELALNAHLFAGEQLMDAARSLAILLKMPSLRPEKVMAEHPILSVGFALIAYLKAYADESECYMDEGVLALQEISDGVATLCAFGFPAPESATDCQAEPKTTLLLDGQRPEQMYDALKANYIRLNPDCSIEQHTAAMAYFAGLVGL